MTKRKQIDQGESAAHEMPAKRTVRSFEHQQSTPQGHDLKNQGLKHSLASQLVSRTYNYVHPLEQSVDTSQTRSSDIHGAPAKQNSSVQGTTHPNVNIAVATQETPYVTQEPCTTGVPIIQSFQEYLTSMGQFTAGLVRPATMEQISDPVRDQGIVLLNVWKDAHKQHVSGNGPLSFQQFMTGQWEETVRAVNCVFRLAGLRAAGTQQADKTDPLWRLWVRVRALVTIYFMDLSDYNVPSTRRVFSAIQKALEAYRNPASSQELWLDLLPSREELLPLQLCHPEREFDSATAVALATMNVAPLTQVEAAARVAKGGRTKENSGTAAVLDLNKETERDLKTNRQPTKKSNGEQDAQNTIWQPVVWDFTTSADILGKPNKMQP